MRSGRRPKRRRTVAPSRRRWRGSPRSRSTLTSTPDTALRRRPPTRGRANVAPVATQREKGETFRRLHEGEPFVIPNPWDVGSARVLEALGFRALATTSSGFAFTLGRRDGGATLEDVVEQDRKSVV